MSNRRIKIAIGALVGTALLFSFVLAAHLLSVSDKSFQDENSPRLGRIDFQENIDSANAQNIKSFVSSIAGVQKTYFNFKDGILVYSYFPLQQTPANIYANVSANFSIKSKPYKPDEAQLKSGCPVSVSMKNPFQSILLSIKNLL